MAGEGRAGALACLALAAVIVPIVVAPSVTRAQPALRARRVRLRVFNTQSNELGLAFVCGEVSQQAGGGSFEAALRAGHIELRVTDAAHFAVGGRATGCEPTPDGERLHCRNADSLRVTVESIGAGRFRLCARRRRNRPA